LALLIRRVVLIANPAARRGRAAAGQAVAALQEAGVRCDLHFTEHRGHAAQMALAHAGGADAVFVLGGDGTVMEVAGALAGSGTLIGVLPGGTGNLLARAVGIPLRIPSAVRALLAGEELLIDLGRLDDGQHFAVAAGVGIDAAMVAGTSGRLKRRLGVLAYTIIGTRAALRAVAGRHLLRARVVVDGDELSATAAAVMVANFGAVLGRRITLGPGIRADDGVLDVCIFTPASLAGAVRIAWRMLTGNFSTTPGMIYRSGRVIEVHVDPVQQFQADGDLIGPTPMRVVVEPRAARLLVPAPRHRWLGGRRPHRLLG
jgi:diacylglycerol kinase (ATP)